MSQMGPACVKTPTLFWKVEFPSQFQRYEKPAALTTSVRRPQQRKRFSIDFAEARFHTPWATNRLPCRGAPTTPQFRSRSRTKCPRRKRAVPQLTPQPHQAIAKTMARTSVLIAMSLFAFNSAAHATDCTPSPTNKQRCNGGSSAPLSGQELIFDDSDLFQRQPDGTYR